MSVLKLELTEDHLKILKFLRFKLNKTTNIIEGISDEEDSVPFGENSVYEAFDLIINGKPTYHDPFNNSDMPEYSEEQKKSWDQLYSELPIALEIIMFNGHFELGVYKTKYHFRDWKKIISK